MILEWIINNKEVSLVLLVLFLTILISYIIRKKINNLNLSKKFKIDQTSQAFLKNSLTAVIYLLGMSLIIYLVPPFRSLAVSIFAGAGILAIILGFASQQAFSNIVSGIFIVIFKPFRVGDWIKFQGKIYGVVEDITLRHTVVKDFENKRYIIPNTVVSNDIVENLSIGDSKIRKHVEIGISYDSNVDKAIKIMQDVVEAHPLFIDQRTKKEIESNEPKVLTKVIGFGDSSVNLRAYAWTKDPYDAWILYTDTLKSIKEEFDKKGIEIPFPYRTIVMKNSSLKKK